MAAHSATVLHGRRKGEDKGSSSPQQQRFDILPDGHSIRDVLVLSGKDWERINQQLNRKQIEEERMAVLRSAKEELKHTSKSMVKDWPNTLEGNRRRKLEARALREAAKEEERKEIDLEEAKYQAQKRKEAIEKAKTQQYYQTDRVKHFHSALVLTEVLKERDAQVEFKKLKALAYEGKDREYLEQERREYEAAVQREQQEALERQQKQLQVCEFQKAQVQSHLKEQVSERELDRREGDELKKLAIQYDVEKKQLEQIRFDEKLQLANDNKKQIEDRKKLQEIEQQQLDEEDEECRVFAEAKKKMVKLRIEKEQQLHRDKQERLERIREKLAAQMKQKVDNEDSRIRNAFEEAEAKRAQEEAEKAERFRRDVAEASRHRSAQMKERERKAVADRMADLERAVVQREADAVYQRNEKEKVQRRREDASVVAKFRLTQAEEREKKAEIEAQTQLAQDLKNVELLKMEEQQFQEYAQRVIDHCQKGGRNVVALRKAAREGIGGGAGPVFEGKGGVRPSYMAKDERGSQLPTWKNAKTEETRLLVQGEVPTGKRLGFIW